VKAGKDTPLVSFQAGCLCGLFPPAREVSCATSEPGKLVAAIE